MSRLCLAASCQIEDEIIGEGESRQLGRSCGHTHTHLGRFGITSSNSATLTVRLGGWELPSASMRNWSGAGWLMVSVTPLGQRTVSCEIWVPLPRPKWDVKEWAMP